MNESSAIERRAGEDFATLKLLCPKCTRYAVFSGSESEESALRGTAPGAQAMAAGWRLVNGETICPKCPK